MKAMTGYRKILSTSSGVIERLQEPRRSNRRRVHDNKTKKWAERSVWTMVCAIELGLIKPPTPVNIPRKSETRGRKPGWAGKRTTSKGPAPKPIDSLSNVCVDNRRIKDLNTHQDRSVLEHRYCLPPSIDIPEPDGSKIRCVASEDKVLIAKETTVYNPYNALRNASKKLDIYEYNRGIKNQTGPRSTSVCRIDPADSSHDDSSPENDGIFQTSRRKYKKFAKTSKFEERTGETATFQRVPPKRRYFRRKQKNPYARQANKRLVRSPKKGETMKKNRNVKGLSSGSLVPKINGTVIRESSASSAKKLDVEFPTRGEVKLKKAIDREIDYDDSEIDDSLMVDPSTDLPRVLQSIDDQNNGDILSLSPNLNDNLDLNFESTPFASRLDSLTQENFPKYQPESDSDEFNNEFAKSDRLRDKTYSSEEEEDKTASATNEKSFDGVDDESEKSFNRSIDDKSLPKKQEVPSTRKVNSTLRFAKRRSADSILTNCIYDKENINNNGIRVTRGSIKNRSSIENGDETSYTIGTVIWGNCTGWWPGMIVDAEDVGMCATEGKSWVYWIGEDCISELRNKTQVQTFSTCLDARMIEIFKTKTRSDGNYAACLSTIKLLNNEILDKGPLTQPYHAWVERHLMRLESIDQMILYPYPSNVQLRLDELKKNNSPITEQYLSDLKRDTEKSVTSKPNGIPKCSAKPTIAREPGHLPLMSQKPGVITWAKIMGQKWWPAMIIDFRDCGMKEPSFACQWILWYGDNTLSQVNHRFFLDFAKGILRMKDYALSCKSSVYRRGVLDAAKDYCATYGYKTDSWTLTNVFEWFEKFDDTEASGGASIALPGIPGEISPKYPARIVEGLKKHKGNCTVAAIREHNIKDSDDLQSVISGNSVLEALCLMCLKKIEENDEKIDHPFFVGELCEECSEKYKPTIFAYGDDGKCFFCTVCAGSDTVVICDESDCTRVYCTACLKYLIAPKAYDEIMLNDPWLCFLCEDSTESLNGGLLKPRSDWKNRVADLFNANHDSVPNRVEHYKDVKRKIRVLSLFDGISAGLVVLRHLGIEVDVYYASEIDPDAEMVSSAHFGNEIVRLGDVRTITEEKIREIAPIDLLIGGSPCNDLSLVNPVRLGLHDPNGTGVLVFEYCRIKNLIREANGEQHFFWLFENVASMPSKYRSEINEHLGREPDLIDSANYSPQHRPRLYWKNLPSVSHPLSSQDLQDVLTPNCNRHALVKKIRTVTTRVNSLKQGKRALKPILMNEENDSVWITELEEIFGFPRHYTDVKNLCATKRQKLIGMSWSVQTITEIMRPLCNFFKIRNAESPRDSE